MSSAQLVCLVDGTWTDSLSVADRGLAYGHGLFETLRLCDGEIPLLGLHLARLAGGAERLGIPLDTQKLRGYLDTLMTRAGGEGIIKVMLTAGVAGRGYRYDAERGRPSYILQWFPPPDFPAEWARCGVSITVCEHRLSDSPDLAGIKHLNRLDQVLARAEWCDEFQEGLMMDRQGHLVEATAMNLFCLRDGSWLTPDLRHCGVAGVMRQYLMDSLMPSLGWSVSEEVFSLNELVSMDAIFLCNAVAGIWPVHTIKGIGRWEPGDTTATLREALSRRLPCYG